MILNRIYNKIRLYVWDKRHSELCVKYRKELKRTDFSVISMNCNAGLLYHDLGLEFNMPTVNLFLRAEDYLKFCENLEYYLSIDQFVECKDTDVVGGAYISGCLFG